MTPTPQPLPTAPPVGGRLWTAPPLEDLDPVQLQAVQAITATKGWTAETTTTWHGEAAIRLTEGPRGRGQSRRKFLLVAGGGIDLADLLVLVARVLAWGDV